jgi:WD40 repeat protein
VATLGKHVVSGSSDKTICVWNVETGQALTDLANMTGSQNANLLRDQTSLVVNDLHMYILLSIGGRNMFISYQYENSGGWTSYLKTGRTPKPSNHLLLFWVPVQSRQGLCDAKSLFVLGPRRVQLDLSKFVHGTSWTQCQQPINEEISNISL